MAFTARPKLRPQGALYAAVPAALRQPGRARRPELQLGRRMGGAGGAAGKRVGGAEEVKGALQRVICCLFLGIDETKLI